MKLHILSDLHVEFAPFVPPVTGADVVVLAGDIHQGSTGLAWARETFATQEIVYVAGNHEFYRHDWDALLPELRGEAQRHGIHLLENDEAVIGGLRFLGASLWTDFDYFGPARRRESMRACVDYLTDFRLVGARATIDDAGAGLPVPSAGPGLLTPAHVRRRHLQSRQWLEQRLHAPHEGPTVVVTHHLPGSGSVAYRFREDLGNAGFASHLDHLMGHAALWIHGHTHDSFNYRAGGTRVMCNPRGYPVRDAFENPEFDPGLMFEL